MTDKETCDSEYEDQPSCALDLCPDCGAVALHYLDCDELHAWQAQRPEMDDCFRCLTCGGTQDL